ncbi:MAG: MATE family efflux transporter [Clostridiaceae bacterium]
MDNKSIKEVLKLAIPAVGEMILYMMVWVVDTMMVGKYGGEIGVSTVGLSSEILYTIANIFITIGISVAITSLVARKYGAKKIDEAEEFATIGLFLGLILSLIINIFIFTFAENILTLGGAKGEVLSNGVIFLKIASFGLFFNCMTSCISGILRGYGNTVTPLIVSLIVNIITISLDYVLIFGKFGFPSLGIKGSAIATTIAYFHGFIFILIYCLRNSKIKVRYTYIKNLTLSKVKSLVFLAAPSSMQEASFSIARLLSVFIIMRIGTVAFAANQITTTIESLSFMPGWGFAVAATSLVGQKIGEKDYKSAKTYAYTSMYLGTATMALCATVFFIFPDFLISLFIESTNKEVISLGAQCLRLAAFEQIFIAIGMILGGALKGAGNTKTPFFISLVSSWVIRLPLIYYFVYINNYPVTAVWIITTIQWIFEATLILMLFKKFINSPKF